MSQSGLAAVGGTETASSYPVAAQLGLLIVLLLSTCVWIGGWCSLIVIARSTTATLPAAQRVAFFRHYGRLYGTISTIALVVALASGLALLLGMPLTALSVWAMALSLLLVLALTAGVAQARRLTRQRTQSAENPDDTALAERISIAARRAIVLRASLGVISVAILVVGVLRMA